VADIRQVQAYYEGVVEPIYRAAFGAALHLAMFEQEGESREQAQQRTKEFLITRLPPVSGETTIIDLGSGYGDMTRYLAQRFGCQVIGANLVHTQNVLALEFNRQAGLEQRVATIGADFNCVPLASGCANIVWCQESLLHAPDRGHVLKEAARLLQSGGVFIFTDLLQTGQMEVEEAQLIYERVSIDSFETFASYHRHLQAAGLQAKEVVDLSHYVARSYQNHIDEMQQARAALDKAVGADFVDYTMTAMGRWVKAAAEGKLGWGMFAARKP
jgi:cyclopropane fatty-acyl-phospholipid synthase-like methyltransferase